MKLINKKIASKEGHIGWSRFFFFYQLKPLPIQSGKQNERLI
jgi:hypothetical protein